MNLSQKETDTLASACCIGFCWPILLTEGSLKSISANRIGLEWPIQEKKTQKTRIDLSYRLSLADTKKTELKEDCRSAYRPACIGLL
ncbi:unnamed protein product [Cochlearia groenlandica]